MINLDDNKRLLILYEWSTMIKQTGSLNIQQNFYVRMTSV